MTTDIDATVQGDELDVTSLIGALAKKRIVPRIRDAERFASESLVLLLKHQPTGVALDVSMAWTDFEREAITACSLTAFGSAAAPMAQAQDLIIFKAIAGRPKDIQDATTLLVLYRTIRSAAGARSLGQTPVGQVGAGTVRCLRRVTLTIVRARDSCGMRSAHRMNLLRTMNITNEHLESISDLDLSAVHGGGFMDKLKGWLTVAGSGKATGTGPSSFMEVLDNPPRALNWARDTLGIAPSGKPGDIYHPATANGDGSINDGYFETPSSFGPQVPQSQ